MLNSFKKYLIEEERTVFFTFGRMNPPTTGHEKLMNELAKKSEIILDKTLNNHGTFDIITIDSLFHRIIRSFSKELELSYNFDVEIEPEIIINESADYFSNQVGKEKLTSNLLERFIYQTISDEENNWRLKEDLIETGKLILNENDSCAMFLISIHVHCH
mgnify:CR=1 FL=1